ncbi:peptidoglycan DD-metalloendopeptidase family protein [Xylophilus rhododendri]|uniref:Peptidoglycan DD-metalloendopeptidase family protein n=1 Tax=Xylophilus rhododendri TaxID=2697032 RepID=A0A857J9E7_9BURK|nr:M23 family metallopeptidase [Xylophilus rhododendri]QHI99612.1 peptidoglycan DD-metalloendopeptidase family protein [Xylophilus rhododendri]
MNNGFQAAAQALLQRAAQGIQQHPRRIGAALGAVLLCGGGGAFAVASYGPDASDLPVREVLHSVTPLAFKGDLADVERAPMRLYRSETTRSSDSAETLLRRLGISDAAAVAFLRNDPQARQGLFGRSGRLVSAEASEDNRLLRLTVRWGGDDAQQIQKLVIEKSAEADKGFSTSIAAVPTTVSSRLASATISSSLFASTDEAGIPDTVASQVAEIFSNDIDFRRSLRKGDRFSVVYETVEADGEMVRAGRVLSAEFVNDGKAYGALWYEPKGQKGSYFSLDGKSSTRAYLSAPLEFSRVSSGFSNRFHPILQQWRMHLGTDFAAPSGTPVRTIGDGVVDFAGVQNGYGNVVMVKHRGNDLTVYAHLSKINVTRGQKVSQGQNIGLVGQTGWATGPHLHFEFRVGGVQQDPLLMARQSEAVQLGAADKPAFDKLASATRMQLEAGLQASVASAR